MPNIQILSDLHFEFHKDGGKSFISSLDPKGIDVLVVAGDLCVPRMLRECLSALCDKYPHIVYILGNHIYYNNSHKEVWELLNEIEIKNLHVLENNTVTLYDQRFIGCTLWFKNRPDNRFYQNNLNDFLLIRGFKSWVYIKNQESMKYLNENIKFDDIVVTHHIPCPAGVHSDYKNSNLNRFFMCDMTWAIEEKKPKIWIFGHSHNSCDKIVEETRIVCNSFGYLKREENPEFDWKKIIKI